jgi:NADH-quinone oxidoreductase subunit B
MTQENFIVTRIEDVLNWGRKSSAWYLLFGTACCAIELMQTGGPRSDIERFGMVPRASPRQADLIIVAGTVTYKMASRIKTLYDQMPEPKYVISMGSCSNCGGLFQLAYSVLKGIDQVIPVDVYVPGCPPRPEALIDGLMKIQARMQEERGWLRRLWTRGRAAVGAAAAGAPSVVPPVAEASAAAPNPLTPPGRNTGTMDPG